MQLFGSLNILWYCLSLGLEWKLTFFSPMATAEFSKFADILCSTLTASYFSFLNSSARIPSPLLGLFMVMLPKAHLTSHSRMSGSRWVITPSSLSGSWRSFLYSSSMYSWHAAKSLQSCLTLCDPRDGSPPGSPAPGILQARTLEWVLGYKWMNMWINKVSSSCTFPITTII